MSARTLSQQICEALAILEDEGYTVTEAAGGGAGMNLSDGRVSILRNCGPLRVAFEGLLRAVKQYRVEGRAFGGMSDAAVPADAGTDSRPPRREARTPVRRALLPAAEEAFKTGAQPPAIHVGRLLESDRGPTT